MWMLVNGPEISQDAQGVFWHRRQPVFVALGVTNMNPHVYGVYVANRQFDTFAKTESPSPRRSPML